MYRGLNVIVIVPVFNEEAKIGKVLARMPREIADEVLVVDDGSTDDSLEVARSSGAKVISMDATLGVGAALQIGYDYAVSRQYDVTITVAGNNKDAPEEIPSLLDPIAEGLADFVQGSRFLTAWRQLRCDAAVSTDCHAPASAALFASRTTLGHRINQWVSRRAHVHS